MVNNGTSKDWVENDQIQMVAGNFNDSEKWTLLGKTLTQYGHQKK